MIRFLSISGAILLLILALLYSGYRHARVANSFIPVINLQDQNQEIKSISSDLIEIRNPWYLLQINDSGNVTVKTPSNEALLTDLGYFAKYEGYDDFVGLRNISVKKNSDSTIFLSGIGSQGVFVEILFTVPGSKPKLDIDIKTRYNSEIMVARESLVAEFDVPVTEVYKKNRKTAKKPFDTEYWLDKQGVKFGNNSNSALIYHTPKISSLQLNMKDNRLFINLDYYLDHPFVHVPFHENGHWENYSKSIYGTGSERKNSFSIYFGKLPQVTPRLMAVPNGCLAGYVFSEHADGGTIQKHRAAYFGSEFIIHIDSATGGFAGHKIPVTKSVFYIDDDGCLSESSQQYSQFNSQVFDFLKQLQATGMYDICLHTPEDLNSGVEVLEESVKFMNEHFETESWIDHGMYNGLINREAFICDGLDPKSEYYAADIWEKHGTKYFWNPTVEFINDASYFSLFEEFKKLNFHTVSDHSWSRYFSSKELRDMGFFRALIELVNRYPIKREMNSHLPNNGNYYPTPIYWKHSTRTKDFYSWSTDYAKVYKNGFWDNTEKQILRNERKQFEFLLSNWGIFIEHGYYVRGTDGDADILSNINGAYYINPTFDKVLAYIAQLRDNGDIYLTTVKDLMEYWISLENISFEYLPDGRVEIINNNENSIQGLSLALQAGNAFIIGKTTTTRKVNDDLILWFDIGAKERVILEINSK